MVVLPTPDGPLRTRSNPAAIKRYYGARAKFDNEKITGKIKQNYGWDCPAQNCWYSFNTVLSGNAVRQRGPYCAFICCAKIHSSCTVCDKVFFHHGKPVPTKLFELPLEDAAPDGRDTTLAATVLATQTKIRNKIRVLVFMFKLRAIGRLLPRQ